MSRIDTEQVKYVIARLIEETVDKMIDELVDRLKDEIPKRLVESLGPATLEDYTEAADAARRRSKMKLHSDIDKYVRTVESGPRRAFAHIHEETIGLLRRAARLAMSKSKGRRLPMSTQDIIVLIRNIDPDAEISRHPQGARSLGRIMAECRRHDVRTGFKFLRKYANKAEYISDVRSEPTT